MGVWRPRVTPRGDPPPPAAIRSTIAASRRNSEGVTTSRWPTAYEIPALVLGW